jgi:hypothetical protein
MLATCLAGLADAKSRLGDNAIASDLERQSTAILISIGDALPSEAITLQRLIMASANRRQLAANRRQAVSMARLRQPFEASGRGRGRIPSNRRCPSRILHLTAMLGRQSA